MGTQSQIAVPMKGFSFYFHGSCLVRTSSPLSMIQVKKAAGSTMKITQTPQLILSHPQQVLLSESSARNFFFFKKSEFILLIVPSGRVEKAKNSPTQQETE